MQFEIPWPWGLVILIALLSGILVWVVLCTRSPLPEENWRAIVEDIQNGNYQNERDVIAQKLDELRVNIADISRSEEIIAAGIQDARHQTTEKLDALAHADDWTALDRIEREGDRAVP